MEVSIELQKELIDVLAAFNRDKPIWESPIAVGLLTALATISASLLGRWQAFKLQERQSEIEKQLRIHELQMEALKSLSEIQYSITPKNEPIQGADLSEWLSPVVPSLGEVVNKLDDYLKKYGHISPCCVVKHIWKAIEIANRHKWGPRMSDNPNHYEPDDEDIQGVSDLIQELEDAAKQFKTSAGIPGG